MAWNWQPETATPLLLVANRDEFYARPARPLHWWDDGNILAGKDLQAGGTWMGLTRTGRFAALTNYRDFSPAAGSQAPSAGLPSRGALVTEFLNSDLPALAFLQRLAGRAKRYNPFNLLVFDGVQLQGLQSRDAAIVEMQPGMGAVSNADFHSPWPKLTWLRDELGNHVSAGDGAGDVDCLNVEALFSILKNQTTAPDSLLPRTGLPLARERALSAAFITSPDYGTRACSVVQIARGRAWFAERTFNAEGLVTTQQQAFSFNPPSRLYSPASTGAAPLRP